MGTKKKKQTLWQLFVNKQFLKFIVIGGINTLSGTGLSLLFMLFMQANAAFIIGYVLSLTLAYFLNTLFVFQQPQNLRKYLKFCLSYVPNFLINNTIIIVLYNIMDLNKYIAIVCAAAIGIPVTFLCVKLFAFGKS